MYKRQLYTTPKEILAIAPESTSYTVNGENKDEGYKIIRQTDDKIYLALDFIQKYKMCIRDRVQAGG